MFEVRQDGIAGSCDELEQVSEIVNSLIPDMEGCISQVGHISQMGEIIRALKELEVQMQHEQRSVRSMQEALTRISQSFGLCETRLIDLAEECMVTYKPHNYGRALTNLNFDSDFAIS